MGTPTPVRRLFLFDIDGTLITSGGAGERSLRMALQRYFNIVDDLSMVEIAGRTDASIAHRVFEIHGIENTPENILGFFDSYLQCLAEELPLSPGRLLPGIVQLLDALKANPEVALGLLTGNLERGAKLKLTHYGVWQYFEFGAYADDHRDRNALGPFAQKRAKEKHGIDFAPEHIFVLGDTPHDISCARAIGAKAVAIATGGFNSAELAACSPDFLFEDLSDVGSVLNALLGT